MTRTFNAVPAKRESVPLLVGLMGPSGGGKTYSALRLAAGIREVVGGEVFGIDSEARRMLHYADMFKFKHVQFDPPFGSLDYLAALEQCVAAGAGVVIIDSMSHEHEGPGGLLDLHEQELDRLAGGDFAKRERVKFLAWQKPKAARRTLINRLLQLRCNFIFCFRAKQSLKPVKIGGKTEFVQQGYSPIAGEEFTFEQTVSCLLLPKAMGVPTWESEYTGERWAMKLPRQFEAVFEKRQPLDEKIGEALARWAKGDTHTEPPIRFESALPPRVDYGLEKMPVKFESAPPPPPHDGESTRIATGDEGDLQGHARAAARKGSVAFAAWYKTKTVAQKRAVGDNGEELRALMNEADAKAKV